MKKLISLLLVVIMAVSLVAVFSACDGSSGNDEPKSISERAKRFAEVFAEGMVHYTYEPSGIPYTYSTVKEVSDTEFIVSGKMTIVQNGDRYSGTFVVEVSYSPTDDEFDVEDYEISNFYLA